ncbi:MAG TPA: hypothetical protein VGP55_17290 [Chitinophagaceae bacterium]|nr:hypothetical protein [Chitinophagaceae bacterium]
MENQQEVFIKMVLDAWHSKTNQFDKMLLELSDEQLLKEVSPGRNRDLSFRSFNGDGKLHASVIGLWRKSYTTFSSTFYKNTRQRS